MRIIEKEKKHNNAKTKISFISDLHWDFLFHQWKGGNAAINEQLTYRDEYEKILLGEFGEVCVNPSFDNNQEYFIQNHVLFILGDIIEAKKVKYLGDVLEKVVNKYDHIYWIFGNHEFYKTTFSKAYEKIKSFIESNDKLCNKISIIENEKIALRDDLQVLAGTYWYPSESPLSDLIVKAKMNDYRYIKRDNFKKVEVFDFVERHKKTVDFFKSELDLSLGKNIKTVLATHHSTSNNCIKGTAYEHIPDTHLGYSSVLPSSIGNYVDEANIVACIHGHTHQKGVRQYVNEWGIPTYLNTVGYPKEEYKLGDGAKIAYLIL